MASLTTKESEIINLKKQLREGEVFFAYRKKDGTTRKARGTLRMDMIPQSYQPVMRPTAPENIRYWDLDAEGWRSFRPENFLRIIGDDATQREGTDDIRDIREAQESQSPYL